LCVRPNVCSCNDFFGGQNCEFPLCYDIPSNETKVCSGNGQCKSFNFCDCDSKHSGRDCSELRQVEGLWIGLIIIMAICFVSICIIFITIALLFRKKSELPTKEDQVTWVELQEDEDDEVEKVNE